MGNIAIFGVSRGIIFPTMGAAFSEKTSHNSYPPEELHIVATLVCHVYGRGEGGLTRVSMLNMLQ